MARYNVAECSAGFDFPSHMRRLCEDIVARVPELKHIDLSLVAIATARCRKNVAHGLQAALTPLRFEDGSRITIRKGRPWAIQKVVDEDGREMLYILSFYLPRFIDAPYKEKLTTIFHELWHISPDFNGDLRRHGGRCYAHTSSQDEYDRTMWALAEGWLSRDPPDSLHAFLHCDFQELCHRWGHVDGARIAIPKLYPVPRTMMDEHASDDHRRTKTDPHAAPASNQSR